MVDGKEAKVIDSLHEEIINNFKYIMKLKEKGINLFFADTDKILEKLKEDISCNS